MGTSLVNIPPQPSSRVDKAGVRRTSIAPVHEEKFTQAGVAAPRTLAFQLTRFAAFVTQLAQLVHSNPIQSMVVYEDVPVTAGTAVQLRHGLGRRVRYAVVRWVGAGAAAHNFQFTSE